MSKSGNKILGYTESGIPMKLVGTKRLHKRSPVEDVKNLFGDGNVKWKREQVRRLGFKNSSRMKKEELENIIRSNARPPPITIKDLRVHELKALARARGIDYEPRIRKNALLALLRGAGVDWSRRLPAIRRTSSTRMCRTGTRKTLTLFWSKRSPL